MPLQRTAQIDNDPFSNEEDLFEGGAPAVTGAPVETENHQAVTLAVPASVPVVASPAKGFDVTEILTAEELEYLELGFGAFPLITLDGKEFDCKGQNWPLENSFTGRIISYRPKYLVKVRASKEESKAQGISPTIVYTYDDFNKDPHGLDTSGEKISARIEYWKSKQKGYEIDKYMEVNFEMMDPGKPWDGVLVQLSVSKGSVPRFSGYIAGVAAQRRLKYSSVLTRVEKGEFILTSDGERYRPWHFVYVRDL